MHKPPLIAVVDDSPADALLLSRSISKVGFEVLVAHDGDAAFRIANESLPDVILLDMTMPGRSGLDTCRLLKNHEATSTIPVIFVTAHSDTNHITDAFAAGGADYVTKPFRVDEILARISLQLQLRQAQQALEERNTQLESLSRQLADTNVELARQSRHDALTNLLNRRAWDEAAGLEHERSQRYQRVYSILMLDVDFFKRYNDSQGHQAGDECLRRVAQCIASTCRTSELAGRYGGEEFVIIAPETSAEQALKFAERIRHGVWSLAVAHPTSPAGRLTLSIGVAGSDAGTLDEVVKRADVALYAAKRAGRNIVHGRTPAYQGPIVASGKSDSPPSEDKAAKSDALATVLIIEDDITNRELFRACLTKCGYLVLEAEDGRNGLSVAEGSSPDIIIMDVMMPVMDGIECTRRLKANPKTQDIPVIIVSAKESGADTLAGLDAGADEYLTKPIRTAELQARVRSMVRLSRERKDLIRSYRLRAEQIRILMILLDLCQELGSAASIEQVLDRTILSVAEIATARRISIMLPDDDRKCLTLARSLGLDAETAASVKLSVGEGIAGRVFQTKEPVVVNSEDDPEYRPAPVEADFFAGVPLLSTPLGNGSDILGVLNVTDRVGGRPFEAQDLEYVGLIANIAGVTLYALLNRKARDDARDLIVLALAKLAEHRDSDTGRHVERVTQYAVVLAENLRGRGKFQDEIDEEFIQALSRAVPLHDIGKVAIPDSILRKPGRLTLEEMAIMRTHAQIGMDTLRPVIERSPGVEFLTMAADIVRAHHEWFDGGGYPEGLKGDKIPLAARVVALADVYDALTTDRVYKSAISHERAEGIIVKSSGRQFDPAIVEAFLACRARFKRLSAELGDRASQTRIPAQPALAIS